LPAANDAIATALIVCDFELGIATVPFNRDLLTIIFTAEYLPEIMKNSKIIWRAA